ncbi:MAG: hypothetical protein ACOVQN_01525 [Exiguobacterium sp.]
MANEEARKGVIVIVYPLQFTSRISENFIRRLEDEYEVIVVRDQSIGLTAGDHKQLIKRALREARKCETAQTEIETTTTKLHGMTSWLS